MPKSTLERIKSLGMRFAGSDEPPADAVAVRRLRYIDLDLLEPDPEQPRKIFDIASLAAFATTIYREGLLQPLEVRPSPANPDRSMIVAGERRWRALRWLRDHGDWPIPSLPDGRIPCLTVTLGGEDALVHALIENIQREALTPVEECEAFLKLEERFGMNATKIAERLSLQPRYVQQRLQLARLCPDARTRLETGEIPFTVARLLAQCDTDLQQKISDWIRDGYTEATEADVNRAIVNARHNDAVAQEQKDRAEGKPSRAASGDQPTMFDRDAEADGVGLVVFDRAAEERAAQPPDEDAAIDALAGAEDLGQTDDAGEVEEATEPEDSGQAALEDKRRSLIRRILQWGLEWRPNGPRELRCLDGLALPDSAHVFAMRGAGLLDFVEYGTDNRTPLYRAKVTPAGLDFAGIGLGSLLHSEHLKTFGETPAAAAPAAAAVNEEVNSDLRISYIGDRGSDDNEYPDELEIFSVVDGSGKTARYVREDFAETSPAAPADKHPAEIETSLRFSGIGPKTDMHLPDTVAIFDVEGGWSAEYFRDDLAIALEERDPLLDLLMTARAIQSAHERGAIDGPEHRELIRHFSAAVDACARIEIEPDDEAEEAAEDAPPASPAPPPPAPAPAVTLGDEMPDIPASLRRTKAPTP